MNKFLYITLLAFAICSCQKPAGDKAKVTDAKDTATASEAAQVYQVNTAASTVTWVGSKPVAKHNGTIDLSSGQLSVEDGKVTAGEFVMDMSTVKAKDSALDPSKNEQLSGHLKSADFFDVAKYPTAKFVIVSVEDIANHATEDALKLEGATHSVTGNLTMKDTTKAVTFPAVINVTESGVSASALFHINRTDWGMHYKSDKSLGNQIIDSKVQVGFEVVAE